MTQRLITHLRHVDLAVPDFGKQLDFYTNTWGLTEHSDSASPSSPPRDRPSSTSSGCGRPPTSGSTHLLRCGHAGRRRHPRRAGGRRRRAAGQRARHPADTRRRLRLRFFDNEGRTVEISSDVAVRQHRRIEEGASVPVRLSHVVINSADPEGTRAFYEKHLAFACRTR